jgi:hypothetical protein
MQLLAETLRKRGFEATAVAFNDDFRGYTNDINIADANGYNHWRRFWFANWAIRHYDVFHFFWGVSLFSLGPWHLLDLPLLKRLNKKIIVHFRGLDIVDIKYFDYRRELARGEKVERPPISRPDQLKKLKKWQKYADHILVSEPDLYEVTGEEAILSPQIIDANYWHNNQEPLSQEDGTFRVVHAPSSRRKKGTDFIETAVKNLKAKGYKIELILAENFQAHKIKELYAHADLGVDQLLYGWHGKVSVELMAMGIPVICYIDSALREYRPSLPIQSASPNDFEQLLEDILTQKINFARPNKASMDYAQKYHDVESEITNLLKLYGIEQETMINEDQLQNAKTW